LKRRHFSRAFASLLATYACMPRAHAAANLTVVQLVPLSGGVAAEVGKQVALGAKVGFDAVNKAGGIHGALIRHEVRDDQFKPELTLSQAKESLASNPVAIISFATANTLALIQDQFPSRHKIPVFPTRSGSQTIRDPNDPYVFHVRAGYRSELLKVVSVLVTSLGNSRIAVFYQDDAYGKSGLDAVTSALDGLKLKPVGSASYDRATSAVGPAVATLGKLDAQAIIMVAGNVAATAFVKEYRAAHGLAQLVGISDLDPIKLVQAVSPATARGVGLTQVFPALSNLSLPLVREFKSAMEAADQAASATSIAAFEGFLVAKTIVHGLQAAAQPITGQTLASALNDGGRMNLGGYELSFQNGRRDGSLFTQVGIIDVSGQVRY